MLKALHGQTLSENNCFYDFHTSQSIEKQICPMYTN